MPDFTLDDIRQALAGPSFAKTPPSPMAQALIGRPLPDVPLPYGSNPFVGSPDSLGAAREGIGAPPQGEALTPWEQRSVQGLNATGLPGVMSGIEDASAYAMPEMGIIKSPSMFEYGEALRGVPDVPQFDFPRYIPKRGVSERVADITNDPAVRDKMLNVIQRGLDMGGDQWYNTEQLRDEFIRELGKTKGPAAYERYMDFVAATSPRSKVPENIRNASYYYWLWKNGESMPEVGTRNPAPYGHLAQRQHQANAAVVAGSGWDPIKNPKPPSYGAGLKGNYQPVAVDAHAFRLPGMLSEDPRFIQSAFKADKEAPSQNIRDDVLSGRLSMEDALKRPVYWDDMPNNNEYAAMENYYKGLSQEAGIKPAQGQASAWVGGGGTTGLMTDSSKPFLRMFEDRLNLTGASRGIDPKRVLKEFIRGKAPLLGTGAAVPLVWSALSPEQQAAVRAMVPTEQPRKGPTPEAYLGVRG